MQIRIHRRRPVSFSAMLHSVRRCVSVGAPAFRSVTASSSLRRPLLSLLTASPPPPLTHQQPRRSSFTYPSSRTLDEIVKLPLLIPHTREEIMEIWTKHHNLARNAATTGDFINANEYDTFVENAKKAPLFVVPCFRLSDTDQTHIHSSFSRIGDSSVNELSPFIVCALFDSFLLVLPFQYRRPSSLLTVHLRYLYRF